MVWTAKKKEGYPKWAQIDMETICKPYAERSQLGFEPWNFLLQK